MHKTIIAHAMTAVLAIAVSLGLHMWLAPPVTLVTFNVKETLDAYHDALIEKGVTQVSDHLVQFAEQMEIVTQAYAVEQNAIIMVDAAVVGGARDVTPDIQQRIIDRYEGGDE